jgi:hypothetical protein
MGPPRHLREVMQQFRFRKTRVCQNGPRARHGRSQVTVQKGHTGRGVDLRIAEMGKIMHHQDRRSLGARQDEAGSQDQIRSPETLQPCQLPPLQDKL